MHNSYFRKTRDTQVVKIVFKCLFNTQVPEALKWWLSALKQWLSALKRWLSMLKQSSRIARYRKFRF